jgi:hypothetical protein
MLVVKPLLSNGLCIHYFAIVAYQRIYEYMPINCDLVSFYREYVEKTNVTWNVNGTVSFRRLRSWVFDAENSNGSLSDNVTTLNPVAVVIINFLPDD